MEEKLFYNIEENETHYLSKEVPGSKKAVVISHGMAEHPGCYEELADYLSENGYSVFAIYQIGHGKHAQIKGHMEKGDFNRCVSNINELVNLIRKQGYQKVFLIGHSMGSFISQLYIERFNNIDGLILSGSTAATPIMKLGKFVAKTVCFFNKDLTKPSPFMDKMSFGSYNKPYKEVRTKFDWINRDPNEVDRYIADPYCGFVCSRSFFRELTGGLATMGKLEEIKKISKDLPIQLMSGTMDPVSNLAKGVIALKEQYDNLKIKDVTLKLYEGAHHEIFKDTNKEEVLKDVLDFLNNH